MPQKKHFWSSVFHRDKERQSKSQEDGTANQLVVASPDLSKSSSVAVLESLAEGSASASAIAGIAVEPDQVGKLSDTTPATDPKLLWDEAYDALKNEDPALLKSYEKLLLLELGGHGEGSRNSIEQTNRAKRRLQMDQLLKQGLDKTAKLDKVEANIGVAVKVVLSVKEAIGSALQAVPVAALAWTGICVALQVILNPIQEMSKNRDGILKIVKKMKTYSILSALLLEETFPNDERYVDMRKQLKDHILTLYKGLLEYIIKSICTYHRNPIVRSWRDSLQYDDWSGSMDRIGSAENEIRRISSTYLGQQSNSYLQLLVNMRMSEVQSKIMHELCDKDMTAEIKALEARKEDLAEDALEWVFDHKNYRDFVHWQNKNDKRILWINGDAGTGKTMLMIGIIRDLTTQLDSYFVQKPYFYVSYFLCQGTDSKLNTATAVLKGLIHMLIRQERSLIKHLEDKHADIGSALFDPNNAFYTLEEVFSSMVLDVALTRAFLIVDALDECQLKEPGLSQLLKLINKTTKENHKIRWLISSRRTSEIEFHLNQVQQDMRLDLRLNPETISKAVNIYINRKMEELRRKHEKALPEYPDPKVLKKLDGILDTVDKGLRKNAEGTFLWVALVFKQMEPYRASQLKERFLQIPQGLGNTYAQMMRRIRSSDDAALYERIILVMATAYRPLHLSELEVLADLDLLDRNENIVKQCGFLTVRDKIVYFLHQSAKDYLVNGANTEIHANLPNGFSKGHRKIAIRSLEAMSTRLRKNIYDLEDMGVDTTQVKPPKPDPLASIRYSCLHWIDHLGEIEDNLDEIELRDDGDVDNFLKKHYLHWLEALSLMGNVPDGVRSMDKLFNLLAGTLDGSSTFDLVEDMRRFFWLHKDMIESFPLQIYVSALLFTPALSLTREPFKYEEPNWIIRKPAVDGNWSPCLKTLRGHHSIICSMVYSPDGQQILSAAEGGIVKIWDITSGACIQTVLLNSRRYIDTVCFSPNGQLLASISDGAISIWDIKNGVFMPLSVDLGDTRFNDNDVEFSFGGVQLASWSYRSPDGDFCVWDVKSGLRLWEFSHGTKIRTISFSPSNRQLVSTSADIIKVWDTNTSKCDSYTLEEKYSDVHYTTAVFSPDGQQLVLLITHKNLDRTVEIWNPEKGSCLRKFHVDQDQPPSSITFSRDGRRLAIVNYRTIKIWDTSNEICLNTLAGHSELITSLIFSPNGQQLISGSWDRTIKIWDTRSSPPSSQLLDGHERWISCVKFSPIGHRLASGSSDETIRIWDSASGDCLQKLIGHKARITSIAFSPDGEKLASGSLGETVRIWNLKDGFCIRISSETIAQSICFSPDSNFLAVGNCGTVEIYGIDNSARLQSLQVLGYKESIKVSSVTYSPDGKRIAALFGGFYDYHRFVKIWKLETGELVQQLNFNWDIGWVLFDDSGSSILTMAGTIFLSPGLKAIPAHFQAPRRLGYTFSTDKAWIMWNDQKVLWLPPEYRPYLLVSCAISKQTVVVGCKSGRVLLFRCSSTEEPKI